MRTIYKYTVPVQDRFTLPLPEEARVLDVKVLDPHMLTLWVLRDSEPSAASRLFLVYGTGFEVSRSAGLYLATVLDGSLVWHVFEVAPERVFGVAQ